MEVRDYIQQEATPVFQVRVIAMGSQGAEASGTPVKGHMVEVVHWTLAAGQRVASSWPGAPSFGDSGDLPPLPVNRCMRTVAESRFSQNNLRGVSAEAARGPDEGPRSQRGQRRFLHHLCLWGRWGRGGPMIPILRQRCVVLLLLGQLLCFRQLTLSRLAVAVGWVITAVWVEAAGAWKWSPVGGPVPHFYLLFTRKSHAHVIVLIFLSHLNQTGQQHGGPQQVGVNGAQLCHLLPAHNKPRVVVGGGSAGTPASLPCPPASCRLRQTYPTCTRHPGWDLYTWAPPLHQGGGWKPYAGPPACLAGRDSHTGPPLTTCLVFSVCLQTSFLPLKVTSKKSVHIGRREGADHWMLPSSCWVQKGISFVGREFTATFGSCLTTYSEE